MKIILRLLTAIKSYMGKRQAYEVWRMEQNYKIMEDGNDI